jgi:hypothetical protein
MPSYTFQFTHNVNDKVRDLVTGQIVKIVGISYINGKSLEGDVTFFHNEILIIELENGYKDARYETEVEVI